MSKFKKYFPYFKNSDITYLDNSATTQKPKCVIKEIVDFYSKYNSNTHRSSYKSANIATTKLEQTREYLKNFINASSNDEIIFTSGVTQSINFIAQSFVKKRFDTVIISSLEHHSNISVWHMQNRTLNHGLEVVKCKKNLEFDYEDFERLLKKHPNAFVSITHISNSFGKIHNIKRISKIARKYNATILVDGAQALSHQRIDVQDLDIDFYTISSHKTFGPTGVGAIYIKKSIQDKISNFFAGGGSSKNVDFKSTTLLNSPYKFEAGTLNLSGIIGFKKALEFIDCITYEKIKTQEKKIYKYLYKSLKKIENIELYCKKRDSIGAISFNIKKLNHNDIGILLNKQNIAVRFGNHCSEPIMKALKLKGTIRASIAFYNTKKDIDKFIIALKKAISILNK